MDNHNDGGSGHGSGPNHDSTETERARQTLLLSKAEELQKAEAQLALLPAFGMSSVFKALYDNDEKLRRLCFESPVWAAIWSARLFILVWLGGASWLLIMPHKIGVLGAVLASGTTFVAILVFINKMEKYGESERSKIITHMSLLQLVLGENPLDWEVPDMPRVKLEGWIDRAIVRKAGAMKNPHSAAVWALARAQELERGLGMRLPETRRFLRTGE